MTTPTALDRLDSAFRAALAALSADARRQLADSATRRARALGLCVLRDAGEVDIPLALTPELVDEATERQRARDAAAVLAGVVKTARRVLAHGPTSAEAATLFRHFGPLEMKALEHAAEDVTIARVDWFLDERGAHRALELNATIPAMEAYSDAAARAWIETIGEAAGLDRARIERLAAENGSNSDELLASLLAHSDGARAGARIAIVHRPNDSQIPELRALARRFEALGHPTQLATPDDVTLDGDTVRVHGERPDILYRHIFGRRMTEGSALARVALGEGRPRLQNPINGHLEVKGVLAELSRLVEDDGASGLGLTDDELEALRRVLPWTRLLTDAAGRDPDGRAVASLADEAAANPDRYVLKRSWDYGGKSVLLGREVRESEGLDGWARRVRDALSDGPGAWVVQQRIDSPTRRHLVVRAGADAEWEDVFVDASTFTASGDRSVPGGGVVRFARVGVVNIAGGGGVLPLVRAPVAASLLDAFVRRSQP